MTSPLTAAAARLLLPPILVVAMAVLIKGFGDVGDGFSAGVIAALGLLLQYLAFGRERVEASLPVRLLPPAGVIALLAALLLAFAPTLFGDPVLTHWPGAGAPVTRLGTLELMTAVAFDLAVALLVLGAVVGVIRAVGEEGADIDSDAEELVDVDFDAEDVAA